MKVAYWEEEHFVDAPEAVSFTASLLEVSEFHLFELAYFLWHGTNMQDHEMDDIFCGYMFGGIVPFWVRSMIRKVVGEAIAGSLDPGEFNVPSPEGSADERALGWFYIAMVTFIVSIYIWLAVNTPPIAW